MKTKILLVLTAMISTSAPADQPATNAPSPAAMKNPAPKKTATAPKKPAPKKPAPGSELKTIPLVPGPAKVVASHVNVRGRAGLIGEVVTRMTNGEPVTVIEEVKLSHSKADEPSAWAKIQLPSDVPVWVSASYIDPATKTVKSKKLNVRGGPGENYSVLGTLEQGQSVGEIETKGEWMKIQAPTNAYAFMAAQYLAQEAPSTTTEPTLPAPTEPAPTPTVVAENPPVAAATNTPVLPPPTEPPNAVAPPVLPPPTPAVEEPPQPRIVQREGIIRATVSIQAPTPYELISLDTHKTINYLYTTSTNLDMSRYKGLDIIVTGEEGLDERWRNTPVITIQRIQVIE